MGPAFVQDIGISYNNTTWTALAQAMSTVAMAPVIMIYIVTEFPQGKITNGFALHTLISR